MSPQLAMLSQSNAISTTYYPAEIDKAIRILNLVGYITSSFMELSVFGSASYGNDMYANEHGTIRNLISLAGVTS